MLSRLFVSICIPDDGHFARLFPNLITQHVLGGLQPVHITRNAQPRHLNLKVAAWTQAPAWVDSSLQRQPSLPFHNFDVTLSLAQQPVI